MVEVVVVRKSTCWTNAKCATNKNSSHRVCILIASQGQYQYCTERTSSEVVLRVESWEQVNVCIVFLFVDGCTYALTVRPLKLGREDIRIRNYDVIYGLILSQNPRLQVVSWLCMRGESGHECFPQTIHSFAFLDSVSIVFKTCGNSNMLKHLADPQYRERSCLLDGMLRRMNARPLYAASEDRRK